MFVANRFSHTQPSEALSEIPNELPILGKSLEEMQDWAIKLNGGEWSKDGSAQLWIRSDAYVSHQAVGLFCASLLQPSAARGAGHPVQVVHQRRAHHKTPVQNHAQNAARQQSCRSAQAPQQGVTPGCRNRQS